MSAASKRQSGGGPWGRAALVAALLLPTALAARSHGSARVRVHAGAVQALVVALAVPAALALALAIALIVPALVPPFVREEERRLPTVRRGGLPVLLIGLALSGAVLVVLLQVVGGSPERHHAAGRAGAPHGGPPPTSQPHPGGLPWWPAAAVAATIAAAGVIAVVLARSRRSPAASRSAPGRHRGRLAARLGGADAPLPDDPRAAVLEAYARMEARLADAGYARETGEPPRRFRRRIEQLVPQEAPAVGELTDLVEAAGFSTHRVGVDERRRAIVALAAIKEGTGKAAQP